MSVSSGANVVLSALWGGAVGYSLTLIFKRRKREVSPDGIPCLQYWGPRFGFPLLACLTLGIGVYEIRQSLIGGLFFFGLALPCALSCIHFALYRITLTREQLIRYQWPLAPRHLLLDHLRSVTQHKRHALLHFSSGDKLKISRLLSGQDHFFAALERYMLAHRQPPSFRPVSATRRSTRKG
jgi:hypothetical protein